MKPLLRAMVLWLAVGVAQAADTPFEFQDAETERRYQKLAAELRCLVCQNQSLADSHADLAQDLRDEVYRMLNDGKTDEEIVGFLVERYGDFVLYRPPVAGITYLLWFGPLLLLAGAGVVWWRIGRAKAPVQPDADEAAAIAALTGHRNDPP
jgi:cytochrome c-type biogenesis protein CcmH